MIYSVEKAILVADLLRKFTTGYAHHVAGHYANINFWMDEVDAALKAIDGHNSRFDKLYSAQANWIEEHGAVVHNYCPICGGKCEFSDGIPSLPVRKSKKEKRESRRELVDAMYYFLARCYRLGLLTDQELKNKCDRIGTSIDPSDLQKG